MPDAKEAHLLDNLDAAELEGQMVLQRVNNVGHWTKTLRKLGHTAGFRAEHWREMLFRDFGKPHAKA